MRSRDLLAIEAERAGTALNELRGKLNEEGYGFCVGLVRAAEEAVLVAYESLKNAEVAEEEL